LALTVRRDYAAVGRGVEEFPALVMVLGFVGWCRLQFPGADSKIGYRGDLVDFT
jgi:hypothetical protein